MEHWTASHFAADTTLGALYPYFVTIRRGAAAIKTVASALVDRMCADN